MAPRPVGARISVRDSAGELLMLRSAVAPLFTKVIASRHARITLDFSGVEFMSRSFADEYLNAKASSKKRILERGVSSEVRQMLNLVARQIRAARSRTELLDRPVKYAPAAVF